MMSLWESIFLGMVQGLTEFLPVSSSGHLAILQKFMSLDQGTMTFDVLLHMATLGSISVYFRKEILELIKAMVRVPGFCKHLFQKGHLAIADDEPVWMLVLISFSTIATVTIAVPAKDWIETHFHSLLLIGLSYLLTSAVLWSTRYAAPEEQKKKRRRSIKGTSQISIQDALLIGLAQAVALLPGVSRSGSTISTALLLRVSREQSGKYSFLMAIPVILGAMIMKLSEPSSITTLNLVNTTIGCITAFLVGLMALSLLIPWVKKGKLHYFSYYCLALGILCLFLELGR
ncbi:MAG: undecaprenyl-diphosphate phosphatase [Bdellovibrionota bacterium]